MAIEFTEGDTGSKFKPTCKNNSDGAIINLTGATIKLRYRISKGTLQEKTMTITNSPGTDGVVEYLFLTGELTPGAMEAHVEITKAGKLITSLGPFKATIRPRFA